MTLAAGLFGNPTRAQGNIFNTVVISTPERNKEPLWQEIIDGARQALQDRQLTPHLVLDGDSPRQQADVLDLSRLREAAGVIALILHDDILQDALQRLQQSKIPSATILGARIQSRQRLHVDLDRDSLESAFKAIWPEPPAAPVCIARSERQFDRDLCQQFAGALNKPVQMLAFDSPPQRLTLNGDAVLIAAPEALPVLLRHNRMRSTPLPMVAFGGSQADVRALANQELIAVIDIQPWAMGYLAGSLLLAGDAAAKRKLSLEVNVLR